jgi:hypothetical protein
MHIPGAKKLRVYFFSTPKFLDIYTSQTKSFEEITKQIMQEYTASELAKEMPLDFPNNHETYELRLLEDDEDEYYLPLYDIPELDKTKTLNDITVTSISFCKVKKYLANTKQHNNTIKPGTSTIHSNR